MPIVPAKCTNCGAPLNVDDKLEAAVCPYCQTPYIVEKAINNITLSGTANIQNANVMINNGPSVENLLARALEFEREHDYEKALEYYNRVLDLDYTNQTARNGVNYIKNMGTPQRSQPQETVILSVDCTGGFVPGKFTLTDKKLYYSTKKKTVAYGMDEIESVSRMVGWFYLKIRGESKPQKYPMGNPGNAGKLVDAINKVKSTQV